MSSAIVSALDVAAFILYHQSNMTAMKLQKLLYYCQAWSLVWDEEPLFHEDIEAWANGPVVREIYDIHKGMFQVSKDTFNGGDPTKLSDDQKDTVTTVLEYYSGESSQWLSDLTHREDPWKNARKGLPDSARGTKIISHASMHEYYDSLLEDDD